MPEHFLNEDQVRRALRRPRLSDAQRQRHLEQVERAIAGRERDMDFLRRRSRAEFGVLAAVAALLAIGFVVWNGVLGDGGADADEPRDALGMANATLTALAEFPALTPTATTPLTPTLAPSPTPLPLVADYPCVPDQLADPASMPIHVPVSTVDPTTARWYGEDEDGLWAAPLDRTMLVTEITIDASSLWFAGETSVVTWYGASAPISVTGRQLGGSATISGQLKGQYVGYSLQRTQFVIPAPGCWEITGTAGDKSLTLTVEVLPFEQRPDVVYAQRWYDARPYEPPATCQTTPLAGPASRGDSFFAHYWLDAGALNADLFGWLIANREQPLGVYGEDVDTSLRATARRLDGESGERIEAPTEVFAADSRVASFVFPSAGCWELEFKTPSVAVTFVIYVYPEECAAEIENGEVVSACEPPRE